VTITLVVPPSGFQLDERVYPMLGVLKVAAVLRDAGHEVDVLDLSGRHIYQTISRYLHDRWLSGKPAMSDVYGISATMPRMPAATSIATVRRRLGAEYRQSPRIILGGAHVTMVNAAARSGVERSRRMLEELRSVFDTVVAGDGEKAVFEAIKPAAPFLIDADQPAKRITFRSTDDIVADLELFMRPEEVAAAPWSARDLIDLQSYHCWVGGLPATPIIAQLGCPFGCGFCGGRNSPTFRRVRLRPVENIVAELEHIVDTYGYKGFMFLDDELNVSRAFPELLRAIKSAQVRRKEEWRLCGLLKSELFTAEQAHLMYEAGFRKLLIGFESGDPRILENMKKGATVEDNTRAVELAQGAGLRIKALMSLGHPGESAETIDRTRRWLLSVRPDEFDATVLTIYPGTPYHDSATETQPGVWTYQAKSGDRLHFRNIDQFTDTPYYKGVPGQYESFVWTDHLSQKELVTLRDRLESDVRTRLDIPWPKDVAALNFEHSMGMS